VKEAKISTTESPQDTWCVFKYLHLAATLQLGSQHVSHEAK